MIIVITYKERDEDTGKEEMLASYGMEMDTGDVSILPHEPPEKIGAIFNYPALAFALNGCILEPWV